MFCLCEGGEACMNPLTRTLVTEDNDDVEEDENSQEDT